MPGSEHNFATAVFDWVHDQADAEWRRGKMTSIWTVSRSTPQDGAAE
jgi:hypothetical protein